jgi:hypothetical protein
MLHRLITLAAWALLAFIIYATISPIQDRPRLPTSTSIEHIAAFAILGSLFCLAYPRQTILVCLIVLGGAITLELLQLLSPDRHARFHDAMEKIAGGAISIMVTRVTVTFAPLRRWFQN